MYIQTVAQLAALVEQLRGAPIVAIDTEFVRDRQYFPQLEIIQVAADGVEAIIDYRALGTITPFEQILDDRTTLKVFHAASQDLEIFFNLLGRVPQPLFDTQIAAAMLGLGGQIGYSRLVESVTGVVLLKAETLTDWARRPLSAGQIQYALDDVRYLLPVYHYLNLQLDEMGRQEWLHDEWQSLADANAYRRVAPRDAYRRIGGASRLKPFQLAILRELAEWRERDAVRRNRAAPLILKDAVLVEIARRAPMNASELSEIRALTPRDVANYGDQLLGAVRRGKATPKEEIPRLPERATLVGQESSLVALLQAWLRARAETLEIAPNYLSTTAELEELVSTPPEERAELPILRGWRRRLIGMDLIALVEGDAALGWDAATKRLTLIPSEQHA